MPIVSSKYQITIPDELRRKLRIKAGDEVVFVEEHGKFYLVKREDLQREVLDSFEGLEETERDFRKGFMLRH